MSTDQGTVADDVADAILNYLWRGDALTVMPATTYWGMSTTQPASDGSGITEPTDTAYALLAVNRDSATFEAATGRAISTAVDIAFAAADPAASGYGSVGWIPVWNNASRTTFLGYWALDGGPQDFGPDDEPTFPAGTLTWVFKGDDD